ncbi:MAG: hypothetical protein WCA92_09155 [Terriglobales bacterium]
MAAFEVITEESFAWVEQGTFEQLAPTCAVATFDAAGDLYCGNINNTLTVFPANKGGLKVLANLPFFPTGIAVDNKRGWIYVANGVGDQIDIYSTAGKLLHTIH